MHNAITLKDWCEGKTPDRNDLLGWSNLVFQRSLQTEDPVNDAVAKYFFEQWSLCDKEGSSLAALFERTFSKYPVSGQKDLADQLVEQGKLNAIDLLCEVLPNKDLQKHLLSKPEVWEAMPFYMLCDHLHGSFDAVIVGLRPGNETHGVWSAIERIQEPSERMKFFNTLVGPKLRSTFGWFNGERSYFEPELFHAFLSKLSSTWHVQPAQLMYAFLCLDFASSRDYGPHEDYLEPYSHGIRALIEGSELPRDVRIRTHLPASSTIAPIDGIAALALAAGHGLVSVFQDPARRVGTVSYDAEAAQALGQVFE